MRHWSSLADPFRRGLGSTTLRQWGGLAFATVVCAIGIMAGIAWILDTDAKLQAAGQASFVDWRTYAHAAQRFLSGEPLYSAHQLAGPYLMPRSVNVGYSYPPPSVLLFLPFRAEPYGLIAWLLLNATTLVSGVAMILRTEMRMPLHWALAITVLSLGIFYPFASGMAVGNINVALAGLVAWVWVAGMQSRWVGPVAGVSAVLKVIPGLLAVWPARGQGWRPVAAAAATATVIAVVTLPLFGVDAWRDFMRALANQRPTCWEGTISIACLLEPGFGTSTAKLVGIVAGVGFAGAAYFARSRFVAFTFLVFAILAPVTDGWAHYWLFVYVAIVAGAAHLIGRRIGRANAEPMAVT